MFDKKEIEKLIKNSANYWEKRALSSKLNIMENEEDYLKRITSIYDEARRQIDDKLAATYGRYGKENKLTLKEAYKKLPSAIEKEYKNDVDDYVKKAESGDPKWRQYLLNQSIMHKHTVLNQLQTEYRKVIYDIDMEETGGLFLEKIFTNSNYQSQFARYQAGYDDPFAKVDKTKIKNLIEQDWVGGEGFSNRIWKNKQLLIDSLDDIVIKGLATGTSIDKMSNELAKKMDTAVSNAKRLIMTESARMDNEALLDRYKATGEKQLQFVATLDMKTSEICRIMDGTIINIDDAQVGLNVPPLHPYCRSVMIAYHPEMGEIEERAYRDVETGKTKMGSYKNYGDYLVGELNDKKQAEALASTRNDLQTLVMAVGNTGINTTTASNVSQKDFTDVFNRDSVYDIEDDGFKMINYTKANNEVFHEVGYDEKPDIITKLNDDEITIYRGYHGEKAQEYINQFKYGDNYIPRTMMGTGTFTSISKDGVMYYAANNPNNIVTMQIKNSAKIVDMDDIREQLKVFKENHNVRDYKTNAEKQHYRYITASETQFAVYRGYDIIKYDDDYIILNRSSVRVLEKKKKK